ncbi:histone acetyltransferase p300-like [Mytilus californianus]|uniref:histone acetyltransferase p300-like n=1 Tax=Mytilus californianus TaxID=6549 RepID=UPI002245FE88|nr:histone acetyltransferase p300-like [Mytilus californianus]
MVRFSVSEEGHSYRYNRNKKVFRSKVKKRVLKDFLHKKSSDPCPPVACDQEFIPEECRMKTYFFKNGYKCQGCDNNKCPKKIKELKRLVKKEQVHSIKKQKHIKPILPKTVKVVEIHREKEKRRPSIRDHFPDMSVRTPFDDIHRSGSSVGLPADSVGPNDNPVAPPVARPVSPLPAARPDSPPPAARPDFPPPAARPDFPPPAALPVSPPPAALPVSPPVQPIITSDVGQQRRDPLTVLDAPPSDNEFVNRVRFDSSNANLLQPPADASLTENIQNPFINQNTMQNPFLQNMPAPLQGQQNNNLWPQSQGFMPQNLQGGGQSPEMQLLQNQQILDQLRGQQAALEFQIQQLRGQQQAPTFGQFQMPQFPIGGIPQTQQGLPNNGISQNFQGFPANGVNPNLPGQGFPGFVPQGFPGFGQNTNPFMAGMQQPASNQNLGLNPNGQISQFLNQLPPVPGINSNFQGQVPLNGNFQGQVPLNGNFPGQAPLNGNFLGPTLTAANPLASVQGFANQGQSNVQTSNTGGFVDPVTNQALPASSNSLHGPVTQQ